MQKMEISYDDRFDTLYVAYADKSNSYGDDENFGIVIMRDISTDAITGFTVMNFMKKYTNRQLPVVPQDMSPPNWQEIFNKIKQ